MATQDLAIRDYLSRPLASYDHHALCNMIVGTLDLKVATILMGLGTIPQHARRSLVRHQRGYIGPAPNLFRGPSTGV